MEAKARTAMPTEKPLSEVERKALLFVAEHEGTYAKAVARRLWPNSLGWQRMSSGWNGCRGKGMPMLAGRVLNRLKTRGYLRSNLSRYDDYGYYMTVKGSAEVARLKALKYPLTDQ